MIQARIPPSHEDCQSVVMCSARNSADKVLQLAIPAWTPRQREARLDCQVASSFLHPLLILATAILTTKSTARTPASPIPFCWVPVRGRLEAMGVTLMSLDQLSRVSRCLASLPSQAEAWQSENSLAPVLRMCSENSVADIDNASAHNRRPRGN